MSEPIANAEQYAAWNGDDGRYWTQLEVQFNGSMRRASERFFATVTISPRDRVLDVGCGCGETTLMAARLARAGWVTGIDLSKLMLDRARERAIAAGLQNVSFVLCDAQVSALEPESFDLVISRYGVMFFEDPVAAFRNFSVALKPGGRLTMLVWQSLDSNPWMGTVFEALAAGRTFPTPPPGAPGPFSLADVTIARERLTRAGVRDITFDAIREPVDLGPTAEHAFGFIRQQGITRGQTRDLDEPTRARALNALRATLQRHETPDGVLLDSGSWLITARR